MRRKRHDTRDTLRERLIGKGYLGELVGRFDQTECRLDLVLDFLCEFRIVLEELTHVFAWACRERRFYCRKGSK